MDKDRRSQLLERFEQATELPLSALALAMIPLLIVPIAMDLSEAADTAFLSVDWTIWAIFALELSVRTYLADRRINYLARHWYDLLIVVLPFLRPLRIVRSARALRLLRLVRTLSFFSRVASDARGLLRRRGLQYVLCLGSSPYSRPLARCIFLREIAAEPSTTMGPPSGGLCPP